MEIIINQQKIDYRLQGEKTLGDIINELDRWIKDGDFIIQEVKIDSTSFRLDGTESEKRLEFLEKSPDDVGSIEIIVKPRFEMAYSTLLSISEYIKSLLASSDRFGNINDYDTLLEGIELIWEGIDRSVNILGLKPEAIYNSGEESLKEIMDSLESLIKSYKRRFFDKEGILKLKEILESLDDFFSDIIKLAIFENRGMFSSLDQEVMEDLLKLELRNLIILNNKTINLVEEIVENLQIGNDGAGFNDISTLMEYISFTISRMERVLFSFGDTGNEILSEVKKKQREIFKDITELLKKIESSFDRMDVIEITEIIGTELKESIIELQNLSKTLQKLV